MTARSSGLGAVWLTCLVASTAYAGAITLHALLWLLLPSSALVGVVALTMRRSLRSGVVAVIVVSLAVSEVVNVLSGTTSGPVARGTFSATTGTGLAVLLALSRRQLAFLLGVVEVLAGALALGAGAKVTVIAVAVAGLSMVALALLERGRRQLIGHQRLAVPLLFMLVLVTAAGVEATYVQVRHDARAAASPFKTVLTTTVEPPAFLAIDKRPGAALVDPSVGPSRGEATATPAVPTVGATDHGHGDRLSRWLWAITGLFVLLLVVAVLGRLVLSRLLWRRRLRGILRDNPSPAVAAWLWLSAELERLGEPLPPSLSPDVVPSGDPLHPLATIVGRIAFGAEVRQAAPEPTMPYRSMASEILAERSSALPLHRRLAARWRLP
jgi:hypothetical protein